MSAASSLPVKILQPLPLLHGGVQREWVESEELQDGAKSLQALDGVDEDDSAARELEQEVIQEHHLQAHEDKAG